MEDILDSLPRNIPGTPTWRINLDPRVTLSSAEFEGRTPDKWDHLCAKVLSTRLYAQEFKELFDILAQHQREATKEVY